MSFITDFFSKTGAGSSLVGDAGDIGLGLVQNRGKQIEGEYKVELQKLLNDQTKTKAELDSELAKLNATREAALGEVKTEQTKLYLGYGLAIVAVLGIVIGVIVWIKD